MTFAQEEKIVVEESNSRPNKIAAAMMLILACACTIALAMVLTGFYHTKILNACLGFGIPTLILLAPQTIVYNSKWVRMRPIKYVFMGITLIALLIILIFLNVHAQMLLTLPIIMASFYVSRKQTVIAYLGTISVIVLYIVIATIAKTWDFSLLRYILTTFGYEVTEPSLLTDGNILSMLFFIGLPEIVCISAVEIMIFRNILHGKERLTNELAIQRLSTVDALTGTLNRNSYEKKLDNLRENTPENLVCVYADANGLHELNNTKGHELGDTMLKYIAKMFQDEYGVENVYRTGGDEFVAFVSNENFTQTRTRAVYIQDLSYSKGYAVSIGLAYLSKGTTIDDLIKEAEKNMYIDKSHYYAKHNIDRRRGKIS